MRRHITKITKYLDAYFMQSFTEHRKYSSLLKKIGVDVLLNTEVD